MDAEDEGTEDGEAESVENEGAGGSEDVDSKEGSEATWSGGPWRIESERLQERFVDIFNDVSSYFGLAISRSALATESSNDEEDDIFYEYDASRSENPPRFSTRPDFFCSEKTSANCPVHSIRTIGL